MMGSLYRLPRGVPIPTKSEESKEGRSTSPSSPSLLGGSSTISLFDQEAVRDIEDLNRANAEKRLVRKLDLTVFPVLFVVFMMSFLDRINISNARIQGLTQELDLVGNRFNIALFVSRSLYETHRPLCDYL